MDNNEYQDALRENLLYDGNDMDAWDELYKEVTTKAEWTAAFINTLPDVAFAIILPDGEKDEDGKTTPRDLRKLPHHNETVTDPKDNESVDMPHLINALARVDQIEATDEQKAAAKSHLEAHFNALKEQEDEE